MGNTCTCNNPTVYPPSDTVPRRNELNEETKRKMIWGRLLAKIFYDYATSEENKCEFLSNDDLSFESITKYIVILGGAVRDYISNKPINDIDLGVNKRELSKLFYNHLAKYHKNDKKYQDPNQKCFFWRLYLDKKLLDTQSLCNIVASFPGFKDKLRRWNNLGPNSGIFEKFALEITGDYFYEGYNMKGCDLDMLGNFKDPITVPFIQSRIKKYHRESTQLTEQLQKDLLEYQEKVKNNSKNGKHENSKHDDVKQSYPVDLSGEDNLQGTEMFLPLKLHKSDSLIYDKTTNEKLIRIRSNIYDIGWKTRWSHSDFSINTNFVFLYDVYNRSNKDKPINFTWIYHTADEVDPSLNNGRLDIQNKMIRLPRRNDINSECMRIHYNTGRFGSYHFWRLLKLMVKYKLEWTVDEQLTHQTIGFYKVWINDDLFNDEERVLNIYNRWLVTYVKKIEMHEMRFEAMEQLKFHTPFRIIVNKSKKFRDYVIKNTQQKSKEEIEILNKLFKKYRYDIHV